MFDEDRKPNYPRHLRGLASNRWGGNNLLHEKGLRGSKFGPASRVRHFSYADRLKMEQEMREKGYLEPTRKK